MDLKSKKFWVMIIGTVLSVVVAIVGADKLPVEHFQALLLSIASIICFYLTGQGLADMGKAKAIVEADKKEPPK